MHRILKKQQMYSSDVPGDASIEEIILQLYGPIELLRQHVVLTQLLSEYNISYDSKI